MTEAVGAVPRWVSLEGVGTWTLLGFLLGGVGPGTPVVVEAIGSGGPGMWLSMFVLASMAVGVLGGVLLGVVDLPGRLGRRLTGVRRVALALGLGVLGAVVGAVWGGVAGAAGAATIVLVPPFGQGDVAFVVEIGAWLGAVTAPVGVGVFAALRCLAPPGWPSWVAVFVAAGLTAGVGWWAFRTLLGALAGL